MEYINEQGRHVAVICERCRVTVWGIPAQAMRLNPGPVTCGDCQAYLQQHPDVADAEFQMAISRSVQDMADVRARWAASDAAKKEQ